VKASTWFVLLSALAAILIVTAVGSASTDRTPRKFRTSLSAREEVPAPKNVPRRADGTFTADLDGNTLSWQLRFNRLSGAATAAHIHLGAKGKAGAVLVPLCGPCKSGMKGTARVTNTQITHISEGATYVNIHTARNPAGEIRGQVVR
jgi:hypothetical protein